MESGKVSPENMARNRVEGATAQVQRFAGAAVNAVTSSLGHIIEQVSRLYGYALLIAGVDAIFLSGVSSLPLTKWDGEGVPRADTLIVSSLLSCWASFGAGIFVLFNLGMHEPESVEHTLSPQHNVKYVRIGGIATSAISLCVMGSLTIAPAAAGVNPRFFGLDAVGLLLGVASGILFADRIMYSLYRADCKAKGSGASDEGGDALNDDERQAEAQEKEEEEDSVFNLLNNGYIVVNATLLIGCKFEANKRDRKPV